MPIAATFVAEQWQSVVFNPMPSKLRDDGRPAPIDRRQKRVAMRSVQQSTPDKR